MISLFGPIHYGQLSRSLQANNFDQALIDCAHVVRLFPDDFPDHLPRYGLAEARYQDLFVNLKTVTLLSEIKAKGAAL